MSNYPTRVHRVYPSERRVPKLMSGRLVPAQVRANSQRFAKGRITYMAHTRMHAVHVLVCTSAHGCKCVRPFVHRCWWVGGWVGGQMGGLGRKGLAGRGGIFSVAWWYAAKNRFCVLTPEGHPGPVRSHHVRYAAIPLPHICSKLLAATNMRSVVGWQGHEVVAADSAQQCCKETDNCAGDPIDI